MYLKFVFKTLWFGSCIIFSSYWAYLPCQMTAAFHRSRTAPTSSTGSMASWTARRRHGTGFTARSAVAMEVDAEMTTTMDVGVVTVAMMPTAAVAATTGEA